jgi:two-component system phosphate regulon sensor histidine kinase PhoR
MTLLAGMSLVLVSGVLCFIFYHHFSAYLRADMKRRVYALKDTLAVSQAFEANESNGRVPTVYIPERICSALAEDMRVSIIGADGSVLYDNTVEAERLENHADREEVRAARASGFGENRRFSDTVKQETYYCAAALPNGCVVRIAKTTGSVFSLFERALPAVFGVLLCVIVICYGAAGSLTDRIVKPLNTARLDGEITAPYDELTPFVRAIENQRAQIAEQYASLQERADAIHAIMENMSEGAALLDRRGVLLSANKSALRMFGASTPVEGKNIVELLRDSRLLECMRGALSGSRSEMDMERAGRNYRVYFSPVTDNGAVLLFLDMTEAMKAEKLRREFSANVSHELKTPLTSIYGYAEMLDGGMVQEGDKAACIRTIKDESGRLITLIEDIMLLSRLDEGKSGGLFTVVDIAAVVKEAAAPLMRKAAELGVSVTLPAEEGVSVRAVRSMMAELCFNLIDNAIKYNKPEGAVTVEITKGNGEVTLSVSDTGIGIPQEAQGRVFERFYRADKSRSKKTGGTGLGLAIVKHIAALHKAEIALESREDRGTKITVCFAGMRNE